MPQYDHVAFAGHGDLTVSAPEPPTDPPGIWGPTDPRPTPPIVIPPNWISDGVPSHPIVLPPPRPAHPIVIPPDAIAPGVPTHPIVLPPPPHPAHPIVIPPGALAPGVPTHPIYLPPGIWGPTDPRPSPPIFLPPASQLPGDAINMGVYVLYQWDGRLVLVPVGEATEARK